MPIISPNMLLPVPVVGVESGPEYANNVNASLTIVDSHNHTSNSGVPVPSGGLDINADLPFNDNNLTEARSVRFEPQPSALVLVTDIGCIYQIDDDLWFNDANGTPIRLTQSGAIAGTPGSISGLVAPASASYTAFNQTFVWQSAVNTPANLDAASIKLRNLVASSPALTLSPPSLGADYAIVLPSLPAQENVLTIDASGNMDSVTWNEVANNRTRPTGTTVAAGGVAISPALTQNFGAGGFVDVTNSELTITTSGRPVVLQLVPNNDGADSYIELVDGLEAEKRAQVQLMRDAVAISRIRLQEDDDGGPNTQLGPAVVTYLDTPSAGTYTYSLQIQARNTANANITNVKFIAYEL